MTFKLYNMKKNNKKDNTILYILGAYTVWYFLLRKKTSTDMVTKTPVLPPVQAPATPYDPLFGSSMVNSVINQDANYTVGFKLSGYKMLGQIPNTI